MSDKESATLSYEAEVNGKTIYFKKRITRRESPELRALIVASGNEAQEDSADDSKAIELCTKVIDKWEFDGSPQDVDAYLDLDELLEIQGVKNAVARHVMARLNASSAGALKN